MARAVLSIQCRSWNLIGMEEIPSPTRQYPILVVIIQAIDYDNRMQILPMPYSPDILWTEVRIERLSQQRQRPCMPIRTYNVAAYFETRRNQVSNGNRI